MKTRPKSRLLIAYYGDDFTGATDVLECLSCAGIKTVLFLKPPTPAQLKRFPGLRAFGIAGGSRSMTPSEMTRALPAALGRLKSSGAPLIHYKTCSTFDSSPSVGSIGKAAELGRRAFPGTITPLVVGVPILGRYVVFGNLFARSGLDTEPSRLDRHPTMSHHPVTPMDEADIRLHLGKQTRQRIELIDVLKLQNDYSHKKYGPNLRTNAQGSLSHLLETLQERWSPPIVLFDTLYESDLAAIGRLISKHAELTGQLFCVGSSGVEYALVAHWRESGLLRGRRTPWTEVPQLARSAANVQIITVSGSCSPVTDRQIENALKAGFVEIPCESALLADGNSCAAGVDAAMARES